MLTLTEQSIYTGNLILVNEHHGLQREPEDFLVPVRDRMPEILLQRCAAILLNELMQEIHGWRSIVPVSGYRPLAEQQRIWDDSLLENGLEFTRKYVALPGHSEHQTGLAIDLGLKQENIDFIRPDFPYTGICQTFRKKASKYGFILRYPAGKECVTGIGHEPWHFRYVGTPHAEIMEQNDLTLEEYIEFVKQFPYDCNAYSVRNGSRKIRISYLSAREAFSVEFPDDLPCTVSGNNTDGFIITEWEEI
ncbi:MAG: M15 family metallopeptidase [Acetatifactor sp.]|nr:M15 family metallopeptidase [Acetatifactor sp.]